MKKNIFFFNALLVILFITYLAKGQQEMGDPKNRQYNAHTVNGVSGKEYFLILYISDIDELQNKLSNGIAQDELGFMWFASNGGGFIRFDGLYFVQYTQQFQSIKTKYLLKRKNGKLLALTVEEFLEIETHVHKDQVKFNILLTNKSNKSNQENINLDHPKLLYEDREENIWIANNDFLILYDKDQHFKKFTFEKKNHSKDPLRSFSIIEDREGNMYIFSYPGFMYLYDREGKNFKEINLPQNLGNINHALILDNGKILVGTDMGLCELSLNKEKSQAAVKRFFKGFNITFLKQTHFDRILMAVLDKGPYQIISDEKGNYKETILTNINVSHINYMFESKKKELWLCTEQGIFQFRDHKTIFTPKFSSGIGGPGGYIHDVRSDLNGKIYYTDGEKVFETIKRNGDFESKVYYTPIALEVRRILPVDEELWITGYPARVVLMEKGRIKNNTIIDISKQGGAILDMDIDDHGDLWLCQIGNNQIIRINSNNKKVSFYGNEKGITSQMNTVTTDKEGNVFFGGKGESAYLLSYDREKDVFENISKTLNFNDLNEDNPFVVEDITKASDGKLYLATSIGILVDNGKNISRMDLQEYTTTSIKALAIDKNNKIWFANNDGMGKYEQNGTQLYGFWSGLPSSLIISRSIHIDKENNIWCGTNDGIGLYHNDSPLAKSFIPSLVSLGSNKKGNNIMSDVMEIYTDGYLSLSYTNMSFPGKLTNYQTQIVNHQEDWQSPTSSNKLFISDLPAGDYQIKLRARQIGNYTWSDERTIPLTVSLIWYKTWWGILTISLLVVSLFYAGVRINKRRHRFEKRKLEKMVNQRTSELNKQKEKLQETNTELEDYKDNLEIMVVKRTEELTEEKEKAEAANIAKTQFLANMSHEIRSPLNAIVGFSQILIKESHIINLKKSFTKYLENIKISGQNLSEIINNILDLSKIEAGKMILNEEALSIGQIFKGIYHINKPKAQEKNIHFTFEYDSTIPKYIYTDRTKVSQILMNLITNAIKFTDGKSIFMSAKRDKENIIFKVTDEGIGIPKEKLKTIFDPFEQVDKSILRKYGGTGLGLSITKEMVELMGGKIWVNSQFNKGSEFTFQIPLKEADILKGIEGYDSNTLLFSKENTVLVAEDNKLNQDMLEALLKQLNLDIYLAENGREAINKTIELKPDLVLMDMHMPEMDGLEATKKIREIEEFKNLPIVAVSADAFTEQQKNAFAVGINEYITKPINFDKLIPVFIKYLKKDKGAIEDDKKSTQKEEFDLHKFTKEDGDKINMMIDEMINIPVYNSVQILDKVEILKSLFNNNNVNTAILSEIDDAVYDGEEIKYQDILKNIKEKISSEVIEEVV